MSEFSLKEFNLLLLEQRCSKIILSSPSSKVALNLYLEQVFTSEDVVCIHQFMMPIVKLDLL